MKVSVKGIRFFTIILVSLFCALEYLNGAHQGGSCITHNLCHEDIGERESVKHETVSVIIPAYWGHARFLENLLVLLAHQTRVPDEVVISLSDIEKVDQALVRSLQEKTFPFKLTIVPHRGKKLVGFNRNSACQHATGDIIICQDADDVPHMQRIFWITEFFRQHQDIDVVIHGYSRTQQGIETFFDAVAFEMVQSPIRFMWPRDFLRHFPEYEKIMRSYPAIDAMLSGSARNPFKAPVYHNGHMSFRRKVFDVVQFDTAHERGEDQLFLLQALRRYRIIGGIQQPLLWYRQQNTSYRAALKV
jgi:glycosyltransferase involved in cell wall biosynthesis